MSPRNRASDPTHFVLLHPSGRDGWHEDLGCTPYEYYRYYTYERQAHPGAQGKAWDDSLFRAGRLAQEWWCASWIKCEDFRLDYLRSKAGQQKLKAEKYSELKQHLAAGTADESGGAGRVVLPNTHRGSRRKMQAAFQDANCLVSHNGTPDLFMTATANANAPEVVRLLKPGQKPQDRPDLVAIVFQQHVNRLMQEIEDGIFGEYAAKFAVLEFQKRGLPHVHILCWLSGESHVTEPSDIDELVSARLPRDLDLLELIVKQMVHDCGPRCQDSHGRCKGNYPKDYQAVSQLPEEGLHKQTLYQRPRQGVWENKKTGRRVTAANIVAHSPSEVSCLSIQCSSPAPFALQAHRRARLNK